MNRSNLVAALVAVVAISAAAGFFAGNKARNDVKTTEPASGSVLPADAENGARPGDKKVLYWYDPMMPNQHFDKPGKSPFMDMELLPKYADKASTAPGITVAPQLVQNLGIRVVPVQLGKLDQAVEAAANVVFNDREVAVIQARSAGFVERVYARAPGDVIAANAPLVDLLVPEWAAAQTEFLAMLKSGDKDLAAAARSRLQLLGMPAAMIARVESSGQTQPVVTLIAPFAGVIQTLDVRAGMSVAAGVTLAKINGLSAVWLEAAVPEAQGGLVGVGKAVEARFAAFPGDVFKARVIAVLPESNPDSRTLRVRAELNNRGGRFKPGMYAQVRLAAGAGQPQLFVPSEAVIHSGRRSVVIVALAAGRFQPVEVETGREVDGRTAILKGLSEGQEVVASGQFLIDSEASLRSSLRRLGGNEAVAGQAEKNGTEK